MSAETPDTSLNTMVQPVEKENYEYYELRESVVTLQPGFKFQKLKNWFSKKEPR